MLAKHCKSVLAALTLLSSVGTVSAQSYSLSFLDSLGGTQSFVRDINNSGQIVGYSYVTGNTARHATLWSGSTVTDLGAPFGGDSFANSINNNGVVAGLDTGIRGSSTNVFRPMVWDGQTVTDLSQLGSPLVSSYGIAFGINDSGVVVGEARSVGGISATTWTNSSVTQLNPVCCGPEFIFEDSHGRAINNAGQVAGYAVVGSTNIATLWSGTSYTFLPSLGGVGSFAFSLNDSGQVVGSTSITSTTSRATLWDGNAAIDLGAIGGGSSTALDINSGSQIVGYSNISGAPFSTATLWYGSSIIDLNSYLDADAVAAGWHLATAQAINDIGWIIGDAINSQTGQRGAFVLSPVPEPSTYALMLLGIGFVGVMTGRRRVQAS